MTEPLTTSLQGTPHYPTHQLQLHTSRYQNPGVATSGLIPLGFTYGNPRFALPGYSIKVNLRTLAPEGAMLRMEDEEAFGRAYRAKLHHMGFLNIHKMLESIIVANGGAGLVLLCYEDLREGTGLWCHRQHFARWWFGQTGQQLEELEDTSKPSRAKKPEAGSVAQALLI